MLRIACNNMRKEDLSYDIRVGLRMRYRWCVGGIGLAIALVSGSIFGLVFASFQIVGVC